jgi:citrate synthase
LIDEINIDDINIGWSRYRSSQRPEDKMADTGLEGVIAAETGLSDVDGEGGRLIVKGRELRDLVRETDFAGTAALLWDGLRAGPGGRNAIAAELGRARLEAHRVVPRLLLAVDGLSLVEGLRAGLALLPDDAEQPPEIRLVGAAPVFTAALHRRALGLAPVAADPTLDHAADYVRMMRGSRPSNAEARAMDTYLVTIADHGLNASTFAARVIASTKAGMVSAVVGALCALKGPLHGGAPGPVLDMLDEIADETRIGPWMEEQVASGARLMGFGHRVYKVRDPRADVLKAAVASLRGGDNRIAFAEAVEKGAVDALARLKPGRRLDTNVEFYTALLLEALGLPREAFTPTFAIGRVLGWTAHVLEQERGGRIIRPASRYVGPLAA